MGVQDVRVFVVDTVCYLKGFREIWELRQIAEPLTKANDRVMYELGRLGNFGNTDNLFKALHEHKELLKMYGWAEEALDVVRSECLERISGNKKLDTSLKGRFFFKDLSQGKSKTI